MNDARALLVMKFEDIEEVDNEDDWADALTSQVTTVRVGRLGGKTNRRQLF